MRDALTMCLSELCLACALCCEGSLFRYVRLSTEEAERLGAAGADVFARRDGTAALRLGCAKLEGTRCSIYGLRPAGCRAFVCTLGRALESGAVDGAAALARVREARALVADVERNLPPATGEDPRSAMQRAQALGTLAGPEPLRRAEAFLREHFL